MKLKRRSGQQSKKQNNQPEWWDSECTNLKHSKYRQLRKFRKTNSHTDFEEYIHYRNTFKNMCLAKRLTLQKTK